MSVVEYSVQGHIATVTLNRPEARNAINPEVAARLADAWRAVRDDNNVRVAVLAGKGPVFCAGADLGQLVPLIAGNRKAENEWDERVLSDPNIFEAALLRDFDVVKPVIAAIQGHAIAGDDKYGDFAANRALARGDAVPGARFGRMFLHARRLQFLHPATGEVIELQAPLPPECAALLHALKPRSTSAAPKP